MTNKEYIEKNNISFSEAMKMYDNEKYPCINDWLKQKYFVCPFEIGDFLKRIDRPDSIYVVIDIKDLIYMRRFNRSGKMDKFMLNVNDIAKFYRDDNTVCYDEFKFMKKYTKIY